MPHFTCFEVTIPKDLLSEVHLPFMKRDECGRAKSLSQDILQVQHLARALMTHMSDLIIDPV